MRQKLKSYLLEWSFNWSNENQLGEKLIHKRVLSDILLDIINSRFWYNNKIINESQFKKLKLKPDEGTRFRISSNDNNDINNCLDSEKVNEN